MLAPENRNGYVHYAERVEGRTVRARAEGFRDYFSQATLFWNSLSAPEQQHLVEAARFELGKVATKQVRERMLRLFAHVDQDLAQRISAGIGVSVPANNPRPGVMPPADRPSVDRSPALSMANTVKDTIKSRRIAVLVANGVDTEQVQAVKEALQARGAHVDIVAPALGAVTGANGAPLEADKSAPTVASVMYDAVYVPGGRDSVDHLLGQGDARHFVAEAFKHAKPVGATGEGVDLLARSDIPDLPTAGTQSGSGIVDEQGVVTARDGSDVAAFAERFAAAIAQHRFWNRPQQAQVPA